MKNTEIMVAQNLKSRFFVGIVATSLETEYKIHRVWRRKSIPH